MCPVLSFVDHRRAADITRMVVVSALCLLLAGLAGCGGGGGGPTTTTPPDPLPTPGTTPTPPGTPPPITPLPLPPPTPAFTARRLAFERAPDYRNHHALVRASHAYARGATGAGVTVGVIDTAVQADHAAFDDRVAYRHQAGYAPTFHNCDRPVDRRPCEYFHGTAVTGIIAAGRTRDRRVVTEQARFALHPSARQLDVELAYRLPLRLADACGREYPGALRLAALATRHPHHTRAPMTAALLLRWQQQW